MFSGTLGTGLTGTTNPDPNTLGTVAPYTLTTAHSGDNHQLFNARASAWVTQASPALFPLNNKDGRGEVFIRLHFVPNVAGSFELTVWQFNAITGTWGTLKNGSPVTYNNVGAHGIVDYIEAPGDDAIYLEFSNFTTASSVSVYYDQNNCIHG